MSDGILRRLDAPEVCRWFAVCDRETDTTIDHPVLGPVPICDRCLERVGGQPVAGWRFLIWYRDHEGVKQQPAFFMNPDRDTCAANVRMQFELWHKTWEIVSIEWLESIAPNQGWGSGKWLDSFKKQTVES